MAARVIPLNSEPSSTRFASLPVEPDRMSLEGVIF